MSKTQKKAKEAEVVSEAPEKKKETTKAADKAQQKAEKPYRATGFKIFTVLMFILTLGIAGTALGFSIVSMVNDDFLSHFWTWETGDKDGNSMEFEKSTIEEVAARVSPGVVSIITETRTTGWFGQSSTSTSAGTGMIVTKDGYVLTNKHVIDGANTISVILDDGTKYDGVELIGTDPFNDVAFLKIDKVEDLPVVTLGDSKTLNVGQQVIAIGNALGQYQNTITSGIISGTGRSLTAYSSDYASSETLSDMIQTDAAINAGNSGGPLVNAAGEVIGINTATSGDADGIGFSIPISSVKGMLKNVLENGKVERAYAGVYSISITPDVAKAYDLPVSSGAYLSTKSGTGAIIKDSPAEKAGLADGDIITQVNGVKVGKAGSISTLLGEYAPGETVQLTVLRGGSEKKIKLTLEAYKKKK